MVFQKVLRRNCSCGLDGWYYLPVFFLISLSNLKDASKAALHQKSGLEDLLLKSKDIVSYWLDQQKGSTITDHKIFKQLTTFWEREYFNDMKALNVMPPNVLTRVTDYVPEIELFVKKIIENGFAYESEGSVYFDTNNFSKKHHYAKLEPSSASNEMLINEGEGSLGVHKKKAKADFALWKASQSGEPSWESKWGEGRPGWHIECSAMAW